MPTLRDLRKKIKAIQSTQKITKAMRMVAAAKLRKVQDRMLNFRPYAMRMDGVLSDLARVAERELHPLLAVRPRKTVEVLVMTADRGLCGAFNMNILRAATNYIESRKREGFEISASSIGRKARDYFRRRHIPTRKIWVGLSGRVTYANAQEIANDLIENYINEVFDEVILIYNEFKTILAQKLSVVRLLPIGELEAEKAPVERAITVDFLYEPTVEVLFERLLPKHIEIQIYRALLESSAAEEAARMNAMELASKNCDDLIKRITLQANKVRQASITKELMDIVGGAEALKVK
ncbi:MAG: ATP synthase F1 subunit gamma [Thermodesulfovibrionales bacterium]|nr:ATP synthase F1 subunit gamma [Thermodesulfovibrionales bacterium]